MRRGLHNVILSTLGVNGYRLPEGFLGEAFPLVNSPNFVNCRGLGIMDSCVFPAGL